jgi:hypothetical protein
MSRDAREIEMAKRTPRCGLQSPGNGGLICNLYANHPGDHAAAWKRTPYDKPCNDYAKPVYKPLGYGFVGGDQSKTGGFAGVKGG